MQVVSAKFVSYIEQNKIDSAIMLMDQKEVSDRAKLQKQLQLASRDIRAFKARTHTSLMLIGSRGDQFYRCRYHQAEDETPALYRIDMYFKETIPGKISAVKLFDSKYMANDFKENQAMKNTPPGIPPPVKH